MATPIINLLKRTSRLSPVFLVWENRLRQVSLVLLVGLIVSGLITAGVFVWLKREQAGLLATREQLTSEIRAQSNKEGLFLLLKARIGLVNQIKSSIKPWDKLMAGIETLATPPVLRAVTNDEKQITVTFQSGSFEEISGIVRNVLVLVSQRVVNNPQVMSLAIDADGQIKLVLGLRPVL